MQETSKKIKIGYFITRSDWGGAQRYVFDLATNLPKDKFDAFVACGGSGLLIDRLKKSDIRVISLPSLSRNITFLNDIQSFFQLLKIIREEKPNIIHLNSSKVGFLGSLAGRCSGRKIIFTAHGWAFNEERSFASRALIKLATWVSLVMQNKIIAVSQKILNQMPKFLISKKKIVKIYHGVRTAEFLDKTSAREALMTKIKNPKDLNSSDIWIGTIAELTKNKGVEYTIMAMSELKNKKIKLIIVGDGDLKIRLANLVRELRLEDRVYFCGSVENAASYMKAFDVFTLTSITEALGYVLIEAGQAQIPCVASDVGGIPEVVANNISGILVPPRDIKAISWAIDKMLSDNVFAEKMARSLNQNVKEKFSFDQMLKSTFELYKINSAK